MSYQKRDAMEQFENWSRGYDRSILQRLLFGPSHARLAQELPVAHPVRVLDVGCGTGQFLERLLCEGRAAQVWGLDLCSAMLRHGVARLRRFNGSAHIVQADSEAIPFRDDVFDVVTCSNCFHHFPDQQRAVDEMYRVLKPGGRLMIVDGYRDGLWGRFIYDFCVVSVEGPVHHASARRFRELFARAGFVNVWQEAKLGLAPFILTVGIASKPASGRVEPEASQDWEPLRRAA